MPGGRPPKSKEAHILDGTYRKDRYANSGVKFNPAKNIPLPETITDEKTIKVWESIIPALCEKGLVSIVEVPILEYAFECFQNAQACDKVIKDAGGVTAYLVGLEKYDKDLTKYRKNFMDDFNSILFKFGVTPAENPKVRTSSKKDEASADDLLGLVGKM